MNTVPANLRGINIVHKALIAGQVLFGAVCISLRLSGNLDFSMPDLDRPLQVIALLAAGGGFFIGNFLFKKRVQPVRDTNETPAAKFAIYRSAAIIQWALLEGPGLFTIICFFLTGNYAFIALAGVLIMLLAMMGPQRAKVQFLLGLREDEMNDI